MMSSLQYFGWLILVFICTSCHKEIQQEDGLWSDPQKANLAIAWRESSPSRVGLNDQQVKSAIQQGQKASGLQSLVIIKNGVLIGEKYFQGNSNTLRHIRSCTKSVVALLTGIAIDQHYLDSVGSVVFPDLSPVVSTTRDTAYRSLSIRHLLTMTGGFQWDEAEFGSWLEAPNQFSSILDRPLSHAPGTYFNYCSPAAHFLGAILSKATDRPLKEFAQAHLFDHLGINQLAWDKDHQGFYLGALGLQLRTRDMAKVGYLLVQRGYNGLDQIIQRPYFDDCTVNRLDKPRSMGAIQELGYGYLLWTIQAPEFSGYLLWGYGGQYIMSIPSQSLVIACTAQYQVSQSIANQQELAILNYLTDQILPSVVR